MRAKNILSAITFLFLSVYIVNAQTKTNNYDPQWKKVDSLLGKKGLTRSALAEVQNIYARAKKENNSAQLIKALAYQIGMEDYIKDSRTNDMTTLEKEILTAQEPVKSILRSMLAENYRAYFQNHRWEIYSRTATVNFNKEDVETWGPEDFHKKITALYLQSISQEALLQSTKLEPFDAIILKGNVRYLRPTLYDLLVHRALEYFRNEERLVDKPSYAFEISDPRAFSDAAGFAAHRFETKDSLSLHYRSLQLYQRLLSFHLKDANPAALVDADIHRLQFVNSHGVMENKDSLFRASLERLTAKYPGLKEADQAWYLLAKMHADKARQYDPVKDTAYRYEYLAAKKICEQVLSRKEPSEGVANCERLLNDILNKEINLKAEQVNTPGQPFRLLVSYRNFTQLHLRIVKVDQTITDNLGYNRDADFWKKVVALQVLKTLNQPLPATNDHQKHNVEIKIDALPVGEYALLGSVNNDFATNGQLSLQFIHVSGISYISNRQDYFVLDRESGKPLAGASVQVWNRRYDYSNRRWSHNKGQQFTTDKNGYFRMKQDRNEREAMKIEITTGKDRLFIEENDPRYYGPREPEQRVTRTTFLFTDRSIYRPGQTMYFKGIMVAKEANSKNSTIIPGRKTKVYVFDANYEKIDSLVLTTSEFGSYSGKFRLPENRLNGNFHLQDSFTSAQQYFSVEEYKRPKFYVEYEPIKGTYRLYDTIQVTGFAKAYAGNNIDGATVKYRVVRNARFLYPWIFWKRSFPSTSPQEIAHGEMVTGADGKFTIKFAALPDKTISKDLDPIFDYEIIADVTDINGETRSGTTITRVSYKALKLSVYAADMTMPADSLKTLNIETNNLAGEFQPAMVKVTFTRLDAPTRLIRKRYWDQPDQFVMAKAEYLQSFPYDEYSDESNKETWPKLEKVFERTDSSRKNKTFDLPSATLRPGWYEIVATTTDKDGNLVKDVYYIELTDSKTGAPVTPSYTWSFTQIIQKEPGETATIEVGTSANDVFVIRELDSTNKENSGYNFITLDNGKKSVSFLVTEADRGGFGVFHAFVKHNRIYTTSNLVVVPWTNKELTIKYETFRDKTLPGSEEKWKVKLTGYKNDKAAAEVLTSMYDASLDQFQPHAWSKPGIWNVNYRQSNWRGGNNFTEGNSIETYSPREEKRVFNKEYDYLATSMNSMLYREKDGDRLQRVMIRGKSVAAPPALQESLAVGNAADMAGESFAMTATAMKTDVTGSVSQQQEKPQEQQVQVRKNFNETAFFFPDLKTDTAGNVEFSFTIPEALTQWKWMMLSHTKELSLGLSEKTVVTQKELMVQPNVPRFVREGDRMDMSAKVVNMGEKEVSGQIEMQLIDVTTNQPVDGWFQNMFPNQYFTAAAGQSTAVNFSIQVPFQYNRPVAIRFIAKAGNVSDGEENAIPVLSNKQLVTETLPLNVRGTGNKNFTFEKLLKSGESETLSHHAVTVEFTSNPAWYAVQALPYLMEYPYECAEQLWNRVYANALAAKIVGSSPRIKEIFEKWKSTDTAALVSNLQKNQELKSVLLEETPWVLDAKSESEQKKRIALLFDMVKLSEELGNNLDRLIQLQSSNGGFVWFRGGPDDRYITQYILTGIGHLKKLNAVPASLQQKINTIVKNALPYLDARMKDDYDRLVKLKVDLNKQQIGYVQINYLYMRSFFNDINAAGNVSQPFNYFRKQSQQFWLQQNRYMQGMIALSLFRTGDGKTAADILRSLRQNAIVNDELGMYWKDMSGGYYWYQAPIETQALLIEAFTEIAKDIKTADALKTWLLKNKQTNNWNTTKATAEACYALLLQGTDWLSNEPVVQITLGDKTISSRDNKTEAGTGYFKKTYDAQFVNNSMGNISVNVTRPNNAATGQTSWGAVYWQYFENLENITTAATPLKLSKKLFVERNTDRGPVLEPVGDNAMLKTGDKLKVRIELRVDRAMEYVHMKDMRAASLEPVNVLSGYKWQGGLGYYESTKDASTNFFFSYLPKGTYVFEYPLFVTHTGSFSNGIATIQCMYAPEFTSHSEGVKINVE